MCIRVRLSVIQLTPACPAACSPSDHFHYVNIGCSSIMVNTTSDRNGGRLNLLHQKRYKKDRIVSVASTKTKFRVCIPVQDAVRSLEHTFMNVLATIMTNWKCLDINGGRLLNSRICCERFLLKACPIFFKCTYKLLYYIFKILIKEEIYII